MKVYFEIAWVISDLMLPLLSDNVLLLHQSFLSLLVERCSKLGGEERIEVTLKMDELRGEELDVGERKKKMGE